MNIIKVLTWAWLTLTLVACQPFQVNPVGVSLGPPPTLAIKSPLLTASIDDTPEFTISALTVGATVELFSDNCKTLIATGIASTTTLDLTISPIPKGVYKFHARQTTPDGQLSFCTTVSVDYEQLSKTPFVSVWRTTAPAESITLPLRSGFNYNMLIDWGDGTPESMVTTFADTDKTHTFASAGEHTIRIRGSADTWYANSGFEATKLLRVIELGDLNWISFERAFAGCSNLTTFAGGVTTGVTKMNYMFYNATNVTPNTSNWNTSAVTTMQYMFRNAASANPDTSNWNTSIVTNMYGMFWNATTANPNTANWNTGQVLDMTAMFQGATSANPNTTNWNLSLVQAMPLMFIGATSANPDTSNWDVSSVIDMTGAFMNATSANPDTTDWDVSSVTGMNSLFYGAISANPNTENWVLTELNSANDIFGTLTLSSITYSKFLIAAAATATGPNITIGAGNSEYTVAGGVARTYLENNLGWTFTDGGPE